MRHFFSARPFPAACPIASLALGVTVPAAPRLLVAVPGGAQRLASGDTAAHPGAVLLTVVTTRADQYLTLTPGTQKQSRIAHRSSPGEEDWTSREHAVILEIEPCASADLGRSPGRDLQVFKSGVASASTPEADLTRTRSRRHGHAGYAELTHTRSKALTLVRADQAGTQPAGQKTKAPSDAFKSEWLSKSANTYRAGCSPNTRTSSKPFTIGYADKTKMLNTALEWHGESETA